VRLNRETYYRNHPTDQKYLYRTYEDWMKDCEQMMADETSGNERQAVVGGKKAVGRLSNHI
jgi:hypothetical protein